MRDIFKNKPIKQDPRHRTSLIGAGLVGHG